MPCKGICTKYKAVGRSSDGRYKKGQKRCQVCALFIMCVGLFCPCCGNMLRNKPRSRKLKEKLINSKEIKHE